MSGSTSPRVAGQAFEEALRTFRKLAEADGDDYLPWVAVTLNNLAVVHRAQNQTREARQALEEAMGIYREFAYRSPEQFRGDVERVELLLRELGKEPASQP